MTLRSRSTGQIGFGSLIAVVFLTCSTPESPAPPSLFTIPTPAQMSQMDAPVRNQYQNRREALEQLLALAEPQPAALAAAYGALGQWHHAYDDGEAADLCYRNALTLSSRDGRWIYLRAHTLREAGKVEAAREAFQEFLLRRPDDVATQAWLGEIEQAAGATEKARSHFQAALAVQPECVRALYGLGQLDLAEGRVGEALEGLSRAHRLHPASQVVEYALGLAYRAAGDQKLAAEHMQRGLDDNRDKVQPRLDDPLLKEIDLLRMGASSHLSRGRRAYAQGSSGSAIDAARRVIEADPGNASGHLNLGAAYLQAGEIGRAIAEFERSLELSPNHPRALFNLAVTYANLEDWSQAEAYYRAAMQAEPRQKEARLNLANLLFRRGEYDKAFELYETVIDLAPALDVPRVNRAACRAMQGREAEARSLLESDIRDLADSLRLRASLARLLAAATSSEVRDPNRALDLARESYATVSNLHNAETIAMAFAASGDFDRAVAWQAASLEAARSQVGPAKLAPIEERLGRYQSSQPWAEGWRLPDTADLSVRVPRPK